MSADFDVTDKALISGLADQRGARIRNTVLHLCVQREHKHADRPNRASGTTCLRGGRTPHPRCHAPSANRDRPAPGRSSLVIVQSSQLCRFLQELFLSGMNHRYIFTSDAVLLGSTGARAHARTPSDERTSIWSLTLKIAKPLIIRRKQHLNDFFLARFWS